MKTPGFGVIDALAYNLSQCDYPYDNNCICTIISYNITLNGSTRIQK